MRFTKKIIERGNLTLPSDIREALGIEDGDFVEFEIVGILKKNSVVDTRHLDELPIQRPRAQMRNVPPTILPDGAPSPSPTAKRPPPEAKQ